MDSLVNIANARNEYNRRFLYYEPYDKQKSFHAAGKEAIERLFSGGNRTGKTYCGLLEVAIHATGQYPAWWEGHRFNLPVTCIVASENYELTRNVHQKLLVEGDPGGSGFASLIIPELILKKAKLSGITGALDYVEVKHKSGGVSTIYFKSYGQGRAKFQSVRCDFILLDEEPPYEIYTECKVRLTAVDQRGQGRIVLTMTPLKGSTEMTMYFLKQFTSVVHAQDGEQVVVEEEQDINAEEVVNHKYYIHASWQDNPHLTQATIDYLRATMLPHEREAREHGIPCIGSGLVYQVPETMFLTEPMNIPDHFARVFGMDVGFNNPTAAVFLAIDRDNDVIYVYAEYSDNKLHPSIHASRLLNMGANWIPGVCDPAVNHGDQRSGAKLVDDYKDAGLPLTLGKYAKELAVTEVLGRIRTGQFKVFNTCRKFLSEWRGYARDHKGRIIKRNDHLMNALEFAIIDGLPLATTKVQAGNRYDYTSRRAVRF